MRKAGEPIDPSDLGQLWYPYYSRLVSSHNESVVPLFAAVPPLEQVATYRWAFQNTEYPGSKGFLYEYHLARLEDAAGQQVEALDTYRAVRAKMTRYHRPAATPGRLGHRAARAKALTSGSG
jgi:hypothetical protein